MEIPKEMVLNMLRERGQGDQGGLGGKLGL